MLGILGIIIGAASGWLGWWSFNEAAGGNEAFYWVWTAAVVLGLTSIILVILFIHKWWQSE
jgi:hypothetical protein